MKKKIIVPAVLIIAAMFTCSAFAADAAKIGVVSFEKILKESSAGKVMQKDLKAKLNELQAKLQAEEQKVKDMSTALEREALVLSAEKKLERQRELRDKADDLKKMNADYTQEMKILQNKRMNQIQKDIFDITNKLGKAQGYTLIIEKKIAGVIYAADKVDFTDEIIKEYNSIYAKKK
ncbi:OmpH family outer membrane protein [Desulfobacter hydrogenophilus]|uniref:OmpH family outer membrane protein n=1 Tax=Desulfobacter hydrogenophilus TaxID=2291 RepID=A0A328FEX6_9BACT|nr:OmpH family outer membrane protein [Desulfobacter hydrogenophilus]NDY72543.1 OmpH family outer membrane protein [Desulfobacter hydrogenophilus]QBH14128.1 OmpH family outer membrane protein [Desulfobacter hydrogenophilus]RAM01583.1 OmpH family outer membrane protein [Desulfobacter hydrogenophilus]